MKDKYNKILKGIRSMIEEYDTTINVNGRGEVDDGLFVIELSSNDTNELESFTELVQSKIIDEKIDDFYNYEIINKDSSYFLRFSERLNEK